MGDFLFLSSSFQLTASHFILFTFLPPISNACQKSLETTSRGEDGLLLIDTWNRYWFSPWNSLQVIEYAFNLNWHFEKKKCVGCVMEILLQAQLDPGVQTLSSGICSLDVSVLLSSVLVPRQALSNVMAEATTSRHAPYWLANPNTVSATRS